MLWFYVLIFIGSALLLAFSGSLIVEGLIRVAKFFDLREFVVGFLIMSFAASAPNLFVGINSALRGVPELSFGDVIGGNVVDLTLAVALAILIGGEILTNSRLVQNTSLFTMVIAVLPLILIIDGELGRPDALILLLAFFAYSFWLFAKEERFKKIYDDVKHETKKFFIKSVFLLLLGLLFLVIGSQGVVTSALFLTTHLQISLGVVGLLIVGLSNSLPEIYFTIVSAQKNQSWLILGNLMGAVIAPATLVLGIVAMIHPIKIADPSPYFLARIFLILSSLFFFFFLRSGRKITRREALILLGTYIVFLLSETLLNLLR